MRTIETGGHVVPAPVPGVRGPKSKRPGWERRQDAPRARTKHGVSIKTSLHSIS